MHTRGRERVLGEDVRGWLWMGLGCAACDGDAGGTDADVDAGAVSANNFGDRIVDKYCEEYLACTGDSGCPLTESPPYSPPYAPAGCTFDQVAAEACLAEEWACATYLGIAFVTLPDVCCEVCAENECSTTP